MSKNLNTYTTFNVNEKTPSGFYAQLDAEFNFDFDPCPLNPTPQIDGLSINWGKRCYINPPYGKAVRSWLEKALSEIALGNTKLAVFLLPAYTDVKWFHEIVLLRAKEIRFIKGRLSLDNITIPLHLLI
jgi:site-specific DNA-methyltransferase (adenine-specific)